MTDMFHYVVNIGANLQASTINYFIAMVFIVVVLIIGSILEVIK